MSQSFDRSTPHPDDSPDRDPDRGADHESTLSPELSLAERVLLLLHPRAIESRIIEETTESDVDWNDEGWADCFMEEFGEQMTEALPLYAQLPPAERSQLIADVLTQMLPAHGPLSRARCEALKDLIKLNDAADDSHYSLPPVIAETFLPHFIDIAAGNLQVNGEIHGLEALLNEELFESRRIFKALKRYLLPVLGERSDDRFTAGTGYHDLVTTSLLALPNLATNLAADPQISAATEQYLLYCLERGDHADYLQYSASTLGRVDFIRSDSFISSVEPAMTRALLEPNFAAQRSPNQEVDAHELGQRLRMVLDQLTLLPLRHDPAGIGTRDLSAGTKHTIGALAPRVEAIVRALLATPSLRKPSHTNALGYARSAIEVFARPRFLSSPEFPDLLENAASRLSLEGNLFADQARDLLHLAPSDEKVRIRAALQGRALKFVGRIVSALKSEIEDAEWGVDVDGFIRDISHCVAITVPPGADAPSMMEIFGLDRPALAQVRNRLLAQLENAAEDLATRSQAITRLAEIFVEGKILSVECQRLLKTIGDLETSKLSAGDESMTARLARRLAYHLNPSLASREREEYSPQKNLEQAARLFQSEFVADELCGIHRLDLLLAAETLLTTASDLAGAEAVARSSALVEARKGFRALYQHYRLYRRWEDQALSSEAVAALRTFSRLNQHEDQHTQLELLQIERDHAKWLEDMGGLARSQLLIVRSAWRRGFELLGIEDCAQLHRDLVHAAEACLMSAGEMSTTELSATHLRRAKQARRMLARAVRVEQHLNVISLGDPPDPAYDGIVSDRVWLPYLTVSLHTLSDKAVGANTGSGEALSELLAKTNNIRIEEPRAQSGEPLPNVQSVVATLQHCGQLFHGYRYFTEALDIFKAALRLQGRVIRHYEAEGIADEVGENGIFLGHQGQLVLAELHLELALVRRSAGSDESALKSVRRARRILKEGRLTKLYPRLTNDINDLHAELRVRAAGDPPV